MIGIQFPQIHHIARCIPVTIIRRATKVTAIKLLESVTVALFYDACQFTLIKQGEVFALALFGRRGIGLVVTSAIEK
ncbi:hypothetical protein C1Y11_20890 [Pseudomonas sp. FW305-20]|uniref:hypothetical protein n=1 Tax=Pseudomonas sp. FW305-33 TaxID=2751337 RepID=UPI000C877879|nr:hypothetical protein [Pseudomonas sp. FW305-33]PMU08633.1 hypothetical protein C1Y11_20890 [Pseudomonas sp. FW305-20]PMU19411.1 hypothetical protein C1Y10_09290 [Pseudomonas sp. FW305-122]PMX59399.1 hypothetical protein C1Y13_17550 [Pseudomonas sp. FW305-33]